MGCFEVDGNPMLPQPDFHVWETGEDGVVGYDGDGAPIKKKYRSCRLHTRHPEAVFFWAAFDDGATHTLTIPAPNTSKDFTDYANCYCIASHAEVDPQGAISDIVLLVRGAAAY